MNRIALASDHRYLSMPGLLALLSIGCIFVQSTRAELVISEFLASNREQLVDEAGDTPDWFELFNTGDEAVQLDGWYATDNPEQLTKWRFPDVTIAPRSFLTVFCSGKPTNDPDGPLHASFRLERSGEYLALVRPDGGTIAWQFAPRFRRQLPDVSYGFRQTSETTTLLPAGAVGRALVPQDASLGLDWTAPEFDDSAWIEGPGGFGFDQKSRPSYEEFIQTDLGESMRRVNASAYVRIPFQVQDPDGFDLLQLRMRFEDGFVAYVNGVEVASKNAPSSPEWDSRSQGRQSTSEATEGEIFDITSAKEHLRIGENILAIHGMNDSPSSSDFFLQPELVTVAVGDLDTLHPQYFDRPSPGLPNGEGFDGVSRTPEFSIDAGAYSDPLNVELTAPGSSAVIRYTLDDSEPDENSTLYESAIPIAQTTIVRAKAFEPDLLPSETAMATYVFVHPRVENFSSNLPIITINMFGRQIPGTGSTTYSPMHMVVFDVNEDTGRATFSEPPNFQGRCGIRVRGSSSAGFAKKNYAVETWDADNDDLSVEILGFAPESDWILHGPYSDKSLMRNVLAYQYSNWAGQWAVKTKFVEVYLNFSQAGLIGQSAGDYIGVYAFMEKIKVDPGRLDLTPMLSSDNEEPEVTGSYVLKNDRADPGGITLRTARGQPLQLYYPKERDFSNEQRVWITNHLNQFEAALYGPNFTDPVAGYRNFIDVQSFIDHHLITEMCKNIDGYRLSTFLYKDRGGKIHMGPVWDYNLSLGNADYNSGWQPSGWYYTHTGGNGYPWYPRLFQDPQFDREYRQRWSELRGTVYTNERLLAAIDEHADHIREAAARNFSRWRILGVELWPNWFVGQTFQSEIDFMKNWLVDRVAWMDGQLTIPPVLSPAGGDVEPGQEVTVQAPSGRVYYTVDGSDPRDPSSGDPSATASLYDGTPIVIQSNTRVRARVLIGDSVWSEAIDGIYVTETPKIALTEFMYDPVGGTDFEFVELYNYGDVPVPLTGARFERGIIFTFEESSPAKVLQPGEYVVVVNDEGDFTSLYGSAGIVVAGESRGSLSDRTETISFLGSVGEPVFEFRYEGDWYDLAAGRGHSLVLIDPATTGAALEDPASWRPSTEPNGSPGRADPDEPLTHGQIPGDSNQDGRFNLSDAIHLLRFLFHGHGELPCGASLREAPNLLLLNTNGDFMVDSADVVYNLHFLFLNGPAPIQGLDCQTIEGCPEVCDP